MSKYRVYLTNTISKSVTVEADSVEEAIDAAYDNAPGSVMFLNHTYPDMGEWEAIEANVEEIN